MRADMNQFYPPQQSIVNWRNQGKLVNTIVNRVRIIAYKAIINKSVLLKHWLFLILHK